MTLSRVICGHGKLQIIKTHTLIPWGLCWQAQLSYVTSHQRSEISDFSCGCGCGCGVWNGLFGAIRLSKAAARFPIWNSKLGYRSWNWEIEKYRVHGINLPRRFAHSCSPIVSLAFTWEAPLDKKKKKKGPFPLPACDSLIITPNFKDLSEP